MAAIGLQLVISWDQEDMARVVGDEAYEPVEDTLRRALEESGVEDANSAEAAAVMTDYIMDSARFFDAAGVDIELTGNVWTED